MSTTSTDFSWQAFSSFAILGFYRTFVGTPLEGIARREVLDKRATWETLRSTRIRELWRGIEPNAIKILSRTYVQVISVKIASQAAPTQLQPQYRGVLIGVTSSFIEVCAQNIWNVLMTRFIQGQGWSVIKTEGPALFTKGLFPAFIHRSISGAIFWSTYEKINHINPGHTALSATCAGLVQVLSTSPLYITTVLRQGANPPSESLPALIIKIGKTDGWVRGLFSRGLLPRFALSMATSGPLMTLLEKYKVVHR